MTCVNYKILKNIIIFYEFLQLRELGPYGKFYKDVNYASFASLKMRELWNIVEYSEEDNRKCEVM
jgi:hypothetical protein